MTVERESCLIKPVLLLPGWGTAAWQPGSSCPLLCSAPCTAHSAQGLGLLLMGQEPRHPLPHQV